MMSVSLARNPVRSVAITLLVTAMVACIVPVGAQAQEKRTPSSQAEIQLSYAPLVKRAAPAVVNVYTRKVVTARQRSPFFDDPFFRRFFGDGFSGAPRQRTENSLGSGVIVAADGTIVTNHHVIEGADEIRVVLSDRREFDATVLVNDERSDIAVLKVETESPLPHLELMDSDEVEVGDLVLAIGNPFGVGQTVTSGIVSALARTTVGITDFSFFIQTDAAINPGNSGGALVAMDGRLVGVNTAIYSRDGGSSGIGFAVPANMVRAVINSAAGGKVVRPWFGASGQTMTADIASSLGLDAPVGVVINRIHPKSPAATAGLKVGDVVLSIDGKPLPDVQSLKFRLGTLATGGTTRLDVLRRGNRLVIDVDLIAPPSDPAPDPIRVKGDIPLSGAIFQNLNPAFNEEKGIDTMLTGVAVVDIAPGSPADRIGFEPGDILLELNGRKIELVADLKQVLNSRPEEWVLSVGRGGRVINVRVRG
jgi:serine protease Do